MTIAGTSTDCPLFQPEIGQTTLFESAKCINGAMGSHTNMGSFNSITSSTTSKTR